MRATLAVLVLVAVGCTDGEGDGGDDALPPPACEPDGVLRWVHDLGGTEVSGQLPPGNYAFVNKLSEDEPGYLDVGDRMGSGDRVRVEFDRLVASGASTSARGFVQLTDLAAGNCETTTPSTFTALADEGWTLTLRDLRAAPYCEGAAMPGSFSACLIPEPF